MKLAEKRAATEFQEQRFPEYKKELEEIIGSVPVNVDWSSLAIEGESHLFNESWGIVYFEPLVAALRTIAKDDLGKTALKNGLKEIRIQNSKHCYYPENWAELQDGNLILDHEPHTNVGDSDARTKSLVKLLESSLESDA